MSSSDEWLSEELAGKLERVHTPAFVIDQAKLQQNCRTLSAVQERSGAKVLLALKGFAAWSCFASIRPYLSGTTASGPIEAQLGAEEFGGEVHVYSPAFTEAALADSLKYADHVVFNSVSQWRRHQAQCLAAQAEGAASGRPLSFGLRVNPEHSEVAVPLYDPCRKGSRLGITKAQFADLALGSDALRGIDGLHFHTLCELGSDALERTLAVVEEKWGAWLPGLKWLNFGGGHHITRKGYDLDRLVRIVRETRERYGVDVYLEPGEAVALDAGVLIASVIDVVENSGLVAVLDVSATAHMPDVLEMPYRPQILNAADPGVLPYSVRLGGGTCLAGDEIGEYSFLEPLRAGDRLVFRDMAIYTMVKTTMFNGVGHPDIVVHTPDGQLQVQRRFSYEDYKNRLS